MFQTQSFRKNIKLITIIDDKIRDGKVEYDINKEAAKISALLSGKFEKYEYLIGEEILVFDQSRMIKS